MIIFSKEKEFTFLASGQNRSVWVWPRKKKLPTENSATTYQVITPKILPLMILPTRKITYNSQDEVK